MTFKEISKRTLSSVVVASIILLSYTGALDKLIGKTHIGKLDTKGIAYFDDTLERALYTFAVARGLNAVISVIQGTVVSGSPGGIGLQFSVGEILDPINDLLERFSWIMLVSTISLGIQKVLMEVGVWFGFKILICFSMLLILIGIWKPKISNFDVLTLGYKLIIISIMIRFFIPAVGVFSDNLYDLFLKEKYEKSTQSLIKIKGQIKDPISNGEVDKNTQNDSGFWDNLKNKYYDLQETINIKNKLSALKGTVSGAVEYIINLIIVFVLQTIVIPILVLWFLIKLSGYFIRSHISYSIGQNLKRLLEKGTK